MGDAAGRRAAKGVLLHEELLGLHGERWADEQEEQNRMHQILELLDCKDPHEASVGGLRKKRGLAEALNSLGFTKQQNLKRVGAALIKNDRILKHLEKVEREEYDEMARRAEQQGQRKPAEARMVERPLEKVYANTSRDFGHWSFWVNGKIYELRFRPRPGGGSSEQESSGVSALNVIDEPIRSPFFNDLMGFTELSHTEIRVIGNGIIEAEYKNYNIFVNNCQGYTRDLLKAILTHPIKTLMTTGTKVTIAVCLLLFVLALVAAFYWVHHSSQSNVEALHRQFNADIKDAEIRMRSIPMTIQSGTLAHQLPSRSLAFEPHEEL